MYILDTCTLLWLVADQSSLSATAANLIKKNPAELFVSAISAFEIALKSRNNKLELPLPALDWYQQVLIFHGIHEIPVSGEISAGSALLPVLHNDPCDRIIIASAMLNRMTIITPDQHIRAYKGLKVLW